MTNTLTTSLAGGGTPPASLTALDRCDGCSARAQARVVRREAGTIVAQLQFCGHHLNKHADALTEQGFTVVG